MVTKPWGYYEDIVRDENFVFKKIVVHPKHQLSYQVHAHRDETWCIKSGVGCFVRNGCPQLVLETSVIHICAGEKHMVKNTGEVDLVIYEFQYGGPCSEDDIIRLDDIYGR
jgi:mannose-6-phosphate isomerase-like protein (cupin superfamily)